jgi:hypothetical protein
MTAIAGLDQKIVCENSQKIFDFKYQRVSVVFAWCGITHAMNESGVRIPGDGDQRFQTIVITIPG